MVLGVHVVLCMTARFFQKSALSPKWGKAKSRVLWMHRKVQFFFLVLCFLSVWSIMKACITVILLCLNKFHIWENSGFWDMAQNALGQSDCRIFLWITDSKIGCISQRKFSRKSYFWPQFGQKGPEWAQNRVLGFLKNFVMLVFLGNNL